MGRTWKLTESSRCKNSNLVNVVNGEVGRLRKVFRGWMFLLVHSWTRLMAKRPFVDLWQSELVAWDLQWFPKHLFLSIFVPLRPVGTIVRAYHGRASETQRRPSTYGCQKDESFVTRPPGLPHETPHLHIVGENNLPERFARLGCHCHIGTNALAEPHDGVCLHSEGQHWRIA